MGNVINHVPLDDPGETGSRVFGLPTITDKCWHLWLSQREAMVANTHIMAKPFSTGFIEKRCWLTRKKELRANLTILNNTPC